MRNEYDLCDAIQRAYMHLLQQHQNRNLGQGSVVPKI